MNQDRIIVAIGGGNLAEKTTGSIDAYIAKLAKQHAGDKRAYGLFVGTASHDSMPYFNTFRKTYTAVHDIKADCALTVYGEMNYDKIKEKFQKADFVYIGGGDTMFMLDHWKKSGVYDLVLDAYNRGVIVCGLSAGAICWFEKVYSDSAIMNGGDEYKIYDGIGILKNICCPHYNHRINDFDCAFEGGNIELGYALEDDSAVVFKNEVFLESVSSGGKAYLLSKSHDKVIKQEL